jgi:hypothetical protein
VVHCHDQADSNYRQRKVLVAPTTKEAQRAELHKTIWRIANELRYRAMAESLGFEGHTAMAEALIDGWE